MSKTECLRALIPVINELRLSQEENTFWISLRRFKIKLPSDSEFHFRDKKEGLIVVSPGSGWVLKIFLSPDYAPLLDEEIGTLKKLSTTRFKDFVPGVLAEGKIGSGSWLKMEYHSSTPIKDLQIHREKLLEALSLLHKDTGRVISLEDWLKKSKERAQTFPSREGMDKLLQEIQAEGKKFPGYAMVEALIHHDVHAGNVLLDPKGHPTFIDWEGEIQGLTLIDFLDFGRREMKDDLNFREAPFEIYRRIMEREFGVKLDPSSLRLSYLIYAAERSLLLYEKRKVDRLADKKGFEARVLRRCSTL